MNKELIEIATEAVKRYNEIIADPEVQEMLRVKEKAELDYNSALSYAESRGKTEGLVEGEKVGLEKGLVEGEKKAKIESARKMLIKGLDIADIVEFTGLSIEEVEGLR